MVQTTAERDYLTRNEHADANKILVIPNAVEDAFFDINRSTKLPPRPCVIWLGTWHEHKGINLLSEIVDIVHRANSTVRFHFIGTGKDAETVLKGFPSASRDRISVTPRASRQEVLRACSEATLSLFTSYLEGFGKAIIEVMAAALPLVSTRSGVAPDVIEDGVNGYLVDPGDSKSAAARLLEVLDRPDAEDMGNRARKAVESYRWPVVAASWSEMLTEIGA